MSSVYVIGTSCTRFGKLPVNLSEGLVSKGHPVGATGLSMIHELATQLRGEAACSIIIVEGPGR
jgi:acetyl-CoA acetyltransferase